jgi:hypothetical protein
MPLRFQPARGASVLLSSSSRGPSGSAATIAVGTVSTLSPGATPTVTNAGTSSAATLNFGLPTTPVIAIGSVSTLSAGSSATVTNSGNTTSMVLDFGIPRGAAGSDGQMTGPGTAVTNEIALFANASGTTLTRMAGTGAVRVSSGVAIATNLPVSNGGTGLASGVAGAILYYDTSNSLAVTSALTTNAMMIGLGASGPSTVSATVGQIWIAQSAAAPVGTSLSGDVTMNASGVTAIGAGKVTYAMVSSGALAAAADIWAATTSKIAVASGIWDSGAVVTLTYATNTAVPMSTGINFELSLTGNSTLSNPTGAKVGQTGVIYINQDATGTRTLAYGTNWKFKTSGTAPTLTTTTSALDALVYHVKATNFIVAALMSKVA